MDIILHVGDYVSEAIVEFLYKGNFHGVFGNMDPMGVREILPRKKIIQLNKYRIGLIHGWGSAGALEERIAFGFEGVDVIVYGHSHRAANHVKDGVLMFNPGSMQGSSQGGSPSFGILELGERVQGRIVSAGRQTDP